MLLKDASTTILLDGKPTASFTIERSVRQGCPLAPYLFLLIGKACHIAASEEQRIGNIQGIRLPNCEFFQLLTQHADDTSLSIQGQERALRNTISLLDRFERASGLSINWIKSVLYWFSNKPRPQWTHAFQLTWAPLGSLSKLLGAPFNITLDTEDIDLFLKQKVSKKLSYWSSQRLLLAGRVIVVNSVLLSTLYYFIAIWIGSIHVLRNIRGNLRDFMWSGTEHTSHARVS